MKTITNITYSAFVLFVFACFALSPSARAVSPAPDGDYGGGNTAEGFNALFSLSTQDGGFNTAVGWYSLFFNVVGSFNTAVGAGALDLNTGHNNTATGAAALLLNTTGNNNTAVGAGTLALNDGAEGNTAVGAAALASNVTGLRNTAVGAKALFSNTGDNSNPPEGRLNTAVGVNALESNTTGSGNTAVGGTNGFVNAALGNNTTGSSNTAVGADASGRNTTGIWNTAVGTGALGSNETGLGNTAIGKGALANLAPSAQNTGQENVALGDGAAGSVISANNVICIGANVGGADVNNSCFIGSIRGQTTINNDAMPVLIDSAGQLGTANSSRRFKTDIKPIDNTSESILALKPVSFRYKIHKDTTPNFGLIAEDVAKVNPDLVIYDADRKPNTVRYEAVNAMLLNEFLKEHSKVEHMQKQIDALTAVVQKVSAQLEVSKPAPKTVLNRQ